MIKLMIFILLLFSMGCTSNLYPTNLSQSIEYGKYHFTVIVVKDATKYCKEDSEGCTTCFNKICTVHVVNKRNCVTHEIDHVLYGEWHGKAKVTCDNKILRNY